MFYEIHVIRKCLYYMVEVHELRLKLLDCHPFSVYCYLVTPSLQERTARAPLCPPVGSVAAIVSALDVLALTVPYSWVNSCLLESVEELEFSTRNHKFGCLSCGAVRGTLGY